MDTEDNALALRVTELLSDVQKKTNEALLNVPPQRDGSRSAVFQKYDRLSKLSADLTQALKNFVLRLEKE